ncbi:hypothetical protein OHA21_20910 [Actinoplanes sp. NBC_00393]|uniref:hypothetical protein n=1 Tax=Actinoplanes sp. NBC_00393 TaxID=2975953 RepID=UPI002E1F1037
MTGPIAEVAGTWALILATPIGRLPVTLVLHHEQGTLSGTATGREETVPLRNITADPESGSGSAVRLTWQQAITRPMRLNLDFDVLVTADSMTGFSRAGRLPRTTVTGTRR